MQYSKILNILFVRIHYSFNRKKNINIINIVKKKLYSFSKIILYINIVISILFCKIHNT